MLLWLVLGGRVRWKWHGLVELAVNELHEDLNALQVVLLGELDGPLGMFEVKRLVGIGRPITQALQEELGAHMLEQNSHGLFLGPTRYTSSLVTDNSSASSNLQNTYPEYYGGRERNC